MSGHPAFELVRIIILSAPRDGACHAKSPRLVADQPDWRNDGGRIMTAWHALFVGVIVAIGLTSASPGSAQVEVTNTVPPSAALGDGQVRPRYIVEGVSFKTDNETGPDWPGSDEIIVRFVIGDKEIFSGKYGDVDAGETHAMHRWQTCIYPALDPDNQQNHTWICDRRGGFGPVNFKISLHEDDGLFRAFLQDRGFCVDGPSDLHNFCDRRGTNGIGTASVAYNEEELARMMPTAGQSVTRVIPIGSGYRVTIRLTRMRGSLVPPVAPDPVGPLDPGPPKQPCDPRDPSCS